MRHASGVSGSASESGLGACHLRTVCQPMYIKGCFRLIPLFSDTAAAAASPAAAAAPAGENRHMAGRKVRNLRNEGCRTRKQAFANTARRPSESGTSAWRLESRAVTRCTEALLQTRAGAPRRASSCTCGSRRALRARRSTRRRQRYGSWSVTLGGRLHRCGCSRRDTAGTTARPLASFLCSRGCSVGSQSPSWR